MNAPNVKYVRRFGLAGLLLLILVPLAGLANIALRNHQRPKLKWVAYSEAELERQLDAERIVLLNFRAEWDLTGRENERSAIQTPAVVNFMQSHGIVPMRADYTDLAPEVKEALARLRVMSIPVMAIYSPTEPDNPLIRRDSITEQQVLDALQEAVDRE